MAFTRIGSTVDVPIGKMKKVNVDNKDILIANVNGVFYALNNRCPHMGGSLADGNLEGDVVTCPRHSSQFNVKTGTAVGKAKIGPLKIMPKDAEMYEVKIDGTDLMVKIN
jgi:3-phenylpropionate/trans-cinnamate dioxygenase ferredoxin component